MPVPKKHIRKHEIIERIEVVGPMSESQSLMESMFKEGWRIHRSGPYTDKRMWPKVDMKRFLFVAERQVSGDRPSDVKPGQLTWVYDGEEWFAETPLGFIHVGELFHEKPSGFWWDCFNADGVASTIEDAKAEAESYYRAKLLESFEATHHRTIIGDGKTVLVEGVWFENHKSYKEPRCVVVRRDEFALEGYRYTFVGPVPKGE